MKWILTPLILLIAGCSPELVDSFSPNYGDTGCKPASYVDLEFLREEVSSKPAGQCCESSGLLMCCFGGVYFCVDGKQGVGCGCPSN